MEYFLYKLIWTNILGYFFFNFLFKHYFHDVVIPMLCCVWSLSCVQLFVTPVDCILLGSSLHGNPQGKNTGVGCHVFLQGIYQLSHQFSSVQSPSHIQLFATPWTAACQASLSITISWSSLKLTSIESVMPSSHLILCRPLLLLPPNPPSFKVFSNESTLRMCWPKYWSFSFSIIPSKEHPGLISFRMDWLDLLAVQGTLKSLLQPGKPINTGMGSLSLLQGFFLNQGLLYCRQIIYQLSYQGIPMVISSISLWCNTYYYGFTVNFSLYIC